MTALWTWIITSSAGRKVAQWAAIAAFALAAIWRIYDAGKDAERGKQAEQSLEALRERNTINDEVAKTPDVALRDELSRWVRD